MDALKQQNTLRGPDSQRSVLMKTTVYGLPCELVASVLHLRGIKMTKQPVINSMLNEAFMWNGEIFNSDFLADNNYRSDTAILGEYLFNRPPNVSVEERIKEAMPKISGPWSFVFLDPDEDTVFFGRDFLGRRSLMYNLSGVCLTLASTGYTSGNRLWTEVPPGIFRLKLSQIEDAQLLTSEAIKHFKFSIDPSSDTLITRYNTLINRAIPSESTELLDFGDGKSLPRQTSEMSELMQVFHKCMLQSVRIRTETVQRNGKHDARIAILFSGGLDCTILAALCHGFIPPSEPIDLLNVSFENPRSGMPYDQVPDRITGRQSHKELQALFPARQWRFVAINVPFEDYTRLKPHVTKLIHPQDTVMDLSIAMAFWFAARGQGVNSKGLDVQSTAKVLFSGLGADELFGGYSRHRAAFMKQKRYACLLDSLQHDLNNLPHRNLGRDDRVISSLGKEVRYPYLCENVVSTSSQIPVHLKCVFDEHIARGFGEKVWLRVYARDELHLDLCSLEPKRAIQFGARTAKLLSKSDKGADKL